MIASLMELLSRPPGSILGKDTNPVFFANYLCNRRKLPLDTVLEILRNSSEVEVVIEPLLREIDATYHKFIFREPTPQEITRHLRQFREELKTSQARCEAVKSGDIRAHLDMRPLNLEMDIVNQCNLRCIMCHFNNDEFANSD